MNSSIKNTKLIFFLSAILLIVSGCATQKSPAEQSADERNLAGAIERREYVFIAKQVSPQRGGMWPLTTYYDLVVSADSINAQLPYFGRAFTAPVDPANGGISFISTDFNYSSKRAKNNRYAIEIVPNDETAIRRLVLTIFTNGAASLRVTSLNRDMISFEGRVEERSGNTD